MAKQISNDNGGVRARRSGRVPDAHGQAAFLLVESLIHGLIARSTLSVEDAIEIVEIAVEVKTDIAAELGDTDAVMHKSLALLGAISDSLSNDIPRTGPAA